jgi:hypothetical protein
LHKKTGSEATQVEGFPHARVEVVTFSEVWSSGVQAMVIAARRKVARPYFTLNVTEKVGHGYQSGVVSTMRVNLWPYVARMIASAALAIRSRSASVSGTQPCGERVQYSLKVP